MNFLAPITNIFKQEEKPVSQALAIPRPVQQTYSNHAPIQNVQQNNAMRPSKKPWEEPKRIQRLRALARLSAHGNACIEHQQINGTNAIIILKIYDSTSEYNKKRMEQMPMRELYNFTTELIASDRFNIG